MNSKLVDLLLHLLEDQNEMKKLLLFTLLAFSLNSYATDWKQFYRDSKSSIYLYDKISKKEKYIYFKLMIDFFEPIYSKSTVLMKLKLDCEKNKVVILSKRRYIDKYHDSLVNRHFNNANLLSDLIQTKLVKKIC